MKISRLWGACVCAILAIGAATASSASASLELPQWGRCASGGGPDGEPSSPHAWRRGAAPAALSAPRQGSGASSTPLDTRAPLPASTPTTTPLEHDKKKRGGYGPQILVVVDDS